MAANKYTRRVADIIGNMRTRPGENRANILDHANHVPLRQTAADEIMAIQSGAFVVPKYFAVVVHIARLPEQARTYVGSELV